MFLYQIFSKFEFRFIVYSNTSGLNGGIKVWSWIDKLFNTIPFTSSVCSSSFSVVVFSSVWFSVSVVFSSSSVVSSSSSVVSSLACLVIFIV